MTQEELQKEIATQTRYLRKVQKEYKDINSSLVELETKNLLKEYDGDTYSQIKKKIDEKLLEKKVQIENARIRLSEKLISTTAKQMRILDDDIYLTQLEINNKTELKESMFTHFKNLSFTIH